MNTYQLSDILKRIANGFPTQSGKPCLSLQTFAFVWDENDINTENLGKTIQYKDEPFFYSRQWVASNYNPNSLKFNYPSLLIWEDGDTISKPFDQQDKATTTYVFKFSDKMPSFDTSRRKKTYCNTRIYEQVVQDLKSIVYSTFKKMGEFALYDLFKGGAKIGQDWYLQTDIDSMILSGEIDNANRLLDFVNIAPNEITGSVIPNAHTDDVVSIFYRITIQDTSICRISFELEPITSPKAFDPSRGCCP